jgi:UDP-glucose 4-epimerase
LASKKLNILILGGNGFIGSHLVEALKNKHQVTVFDKSPNLFIKEYAEVNYVYGDFGNTDLLSKVLDNKHVVYHLLSTTVPYSADINPIFDIESNLIGTVKLLDMIVEKGIQRFVYASSGGTVYGKSHYLPMDEEHPCNPVGLTALLKMQSNDTYRCMHLRINFHTLLSGHQTLMGLDKITQKIRA